MQNYTNIIYDNLAGETPKQKLESLELMKEALNFWLLTFDESKGNDYDIINGKGSRLRPYNQIQKTRLALGLIKTIDEQ